MGSKSTVENKIPAYMEDAGKLAVEEAKKIKEMGYLPYFGPEVAAINPYEQAMAQNVGGMASAFGLAAPAAMDMSGVSTATSGGVTGYTTAPAYFAALERLKETRPDQYEFFAGLGRFDPITGAANPNYNSKPRNPLLAAAGLGSSSEGGGYNDSVSSAMGTSTGYTSFGDMFDGGGPGQSGPEFGGLFGGISNSLGITPSDFGYGDDD